MVHLRNSAFFKKKILEAQIVRLNEEKELAFDKFLFFNNIY